MCHQHAAAYLHAAPLPGMTAIRALEPVVNLARLQIRAGAADDGRHRLLHLFNTVTKGTSTQVEGVHVPADLTPTDTDRHEVRTWLWKVVLADGTRTLTTAGRWRKRWPTSRSTGASGSACWTAARSPSWPRSATPPPTQPRSSP
ncbi:hypothetical protein ACIQVA_32670 [Streptomyces microflavus]|uniref:hypothetical protein n=1 Tax=Streptomyces microflavus TaxID=1919 RepID=UPI0038035F08